MKKIVLAVSFLLVVSPLFAARRPVWVHKIDPRYPDSTYVTGVGVGADLDGARSNARAEISKVFQARVKQLADETLSESSKTVGQEKSPSEIRQDVTVNTQVATESLLEGVQIAETWFDKKRKQHYALAVLDKTKTSAALTGQILEKEEIIKAQTVQAEAAGPWIEKARAYARAVQAGREKDDLAARRRIVDPAPIPELPGTLSTAQLREKLDGALARIQFRIDADGGAVSELKETVTEKINALGFKTLTDADAKASAEDTVFLLKCRLKVEPMDRGNPTWKFFQWSGSYEMQSSSGGKVLASSTSAGSEGHITEGTALMKTRKAGEQALAKEVQQGVSRYIFGQ